MRSLRREGGLIDFFCADLSAEEASAFLTGSRTLGRVVVENLPGFLSPDKFALRYPKRAPEKYLIFFRCTGLMRQPNNAIVPTHEHLLEIVFGLDYPARPPRFVWLTPIWHPNISMPNLCPHGRPFAVGTTLDVLCLMVGQMVQFQIYNTDSALNPEAAEWALANRDRLPVDTRGLLDGRPAPRPAKDSRLAQTSEVRNWPLVELV
jgi:ubiquitin-protein ligase